MDHDRVTVNPGVMGGKPCVKGTRVTVSAVVRLVASGMSAGQIVADYPYLTAEDVTASLRYAAACAARPAPEPDPEDP